MVTDFWSTCNRVKCRGLHWFFGSSYRLHILSYKFYYKYISFLVKIPKTLKIRIKRF